MKKLVMSALLLGATATTQAQSRPVYLDESKNIEQRIDDALSRMTLDEKIAVIHAQSKFSSPGVKRLGFPDLWTDDGPHGVRPDVLWDEWEQAGQTNDSCVAFPALTCLAATWNPQLARLYGESLAEEALYRNKNVMLGPGVNIYRTPLGGRNFEYMGEDPWLASRMVVPYVQGLQSKGVAACVKHYALNNDEEYRHQVNVVVSDRALHEIYLPAFKAAVQEGGAWAIMGAYNLYKNQHNCHNAIMLNKILKQDWGFDGVVATIPTRLLKMVWIWSLAHGLMDLPWELPMPTITTIWPKLIRKLSRKVNTPLRNSMRRYVVCCVFSIVLL